MKQVIYAVRPTYRFSYSRPWLDVEQYEDSPWYVKKELAEKKRDELNKQINDVDFCVQESILIQ